MDAVPDPSELISLFHDSVEELGQFEPVDVAHLPDSFRALLAHHDHMTVTIEAWHNSLVDVRVLSEHRDGNLYARQILLTRQRDHGVVQYGIMRIDLSGLPEIVRLEIESHALPLGRIMIRHHLMREVELEQLYRITPGPTLKAFLKLPDGSPRELYGRTARILVEGEPAVELLEIVTT